MKLIIVFTIIGAIMIFGGIVYLLLADKTEWKCEACVNYRCVANDSICDDCDGKNHYEFDLQKAKGEE